VPAKTFAAIGHVTNDLLAAGLTAGGSALYATLTAAGLGLSARALTSHGPDFVGADLLAGAGVAVSGGGAARTTTFENVYVGEERRARVLAVAEPLDSPADADTDVVLVCPVVNEVGPRALTGRLVGAGLQGWLRRLGPGGVVERHIPDDLTFLAPCAVVFLSVEDIGPATDLVPRLRALVPLVIVTHGARGATIHSRGGSEHVRAYPTQEIDPTGAGDVFATGFLIALGAGEAPRNAAIMGSCAASLVVEAVGAAALTRIAETAGRVARYDELTRI
jgi:sugar/nucleoside kinase (ribokinase family)